MRPLTLHISPCPNDTFMFDALINGRIDTHSLHFEVEYHDIEELNTRALNANADISKISCAVLPHIAHHYSLLGSGAALGRGNGPLLVKPKGSTRPIKHILVPGLHTTASALVTRLYPSIEQQQPMLFSKIAEAVENGEADAGVLIHEGRFVYAERNLELVADLGLLWEEKMQLPLPLGAIVMRNTIDPQIKSKFEILLRQSIEYAFANPQASRPFIKEHAQELDDSVIDNHISLFVNNYSLSLDEEGHEAITKLLY
ncbi:MAG: 1,4-dihydroxy-6-naphthoate synthase [Rikenellaceae bacterium]